MLAASKRQIRSAALSSGKRFRLAREVRADEYGIRTTLQVDDLTFKSEIVLEGRVELEAARGKDQVCGVSTLTPLDMAKLVANVDRWSDGGILSRDVIDQAMMSPTLPLLCKAILKAQGATARVGLRPVSRQSCGQPEISGKNEMPGSRCCGGLLATF